MKLTGLLMLLTLSLGFMACSDDDDNDKNSIVGTWKWEGEGEYVIATFNADGTGVCEEFWEGGADRYTFRYSYSNNMLTVLEDGETYTEPCYIKDGLLYWDGDVYYRVK